MEPKKSEKNTALLEQMKNLEKDWETFSKQSKSRRRCSTGSSDSIFTSLLVKENSPRGLMSALQHRRSPSDGLIWKMKNSDYAVEEIIRDRRAAIKSGKLKGRQLLGAFEGAAEMELQWKKDEEIICSECLDLVQEMKLSSMEASVFKEDENSVQKNLSVGSCSESDCSSEVNQTLDEAEKKEELKVKRVSRNLRGNGGRYMHAMAWFAFLSMLFTLVLISVTCKNVHQDMVIYLVPT
ncbi:Uncharacterized protein Adt_47519 [Abeliophyllum distichum]|uniref:Uncharacterized protein n=1 Tax=Abeliophyllum distichum TaxID=126358 RepID=A0ABD1NTP1_9LAMI